MIVYLMSKLKDTDDWGISDKSFKILEELSPFANCTNNKCAKLYSNVPSPGSSVVNCFMYNRSIEC